MGRHRRMATKNNSINNRETTDDKYLTEKIEPRLGLTKQVCMSCNARNAESANRCRKCGSDDLRGKKGEFSDE